MESSLIIYSFLRIFYNIFIDIDECDSDPCLNGGTCTTPELDTYLCTCIIGYTGLHCETSICNYYYIYFNATQKHCIHFKFILL